MADEVAVSGKSTAQVAHEMTIQLLTNVENKTLKELTRKEYLQTHVDCVLHFVGVPPANEFPVRARAANGLFWRQATCLHEAQAL